MNSDLLAFQTPCHTVLQAVRQQALAKQTGKVASMTLQEWMCYAKKVLMAPADSVASKAEKVRKYGCLGRINFRQEEMCQVSLAEPPCCIVCDMFRLVLP